jgi:archaellum biogenesis protein FlaJ (TadC family)
MSSGTRWTLIYFVMTLASFLYPGGRGRVMVLPFLFMAIIAMLFASAQRSAAREDEEES